MHPYFHARRNARLDDMAAARPHVMSALGDFISSVGWAIKDAFDRGGNDGGDGGDGEEDPILARMAVTPGEPRYCMLPLTTKMLDMKESRDFASSEFPAYLVEEQNIEVPPGKMVYLVGKTQVVFRPEQLILDSNTAAAFEIVDIKVGKNSQLLASGTVPAKFFADNAQKPITLRCDTAQVSMDVTVSLVNVSREPARIRGVFAGPIID